MPTSKPFILVDGSSYLYRAFHALPALMNSKGLPTGAIYGMVNMLKRLIADYQPELIVVVFDAKGKTFRDDIYSEYKATRKAMPDDLVKQIEPIHQVIEAMGLPILMIEGVEADDVIATLAAQAATDKIDIVISTGDKDLAQLVNEHITLINTMTNTKLDPAGVLEKFGVHPHQIVDYLTLVGDTSDNIPGVPKVGPKTAAKWLQDHDSLDNIISNADQFPGKIGENLRNTLAQIPMTKSLVSIKMDVTLPVKYDELRLKQMNKKALMDFYKEMEFRNWLSELLQEIKETVEADNHANYCIIRSRTDLDDWVSQLSKAESFAFDTETTHYDYMQAKLVGLSFAILPGKAIYIPFGHDYLGAGEQLTPNEVLTALKPILENPTIKKIGHNLKYDIEVLASEGISVKGQLYDTMLESYILDSASNTHGLDALALKYLGWRTITFEDIAGKGSKQLTFNQIDIEKGGIYACEDADVTLRLHQILWPKLLNEAGLQYVYRSIEMPLISVLAKIERTGVLIDPVKLKIQGEALQKRLSELEQETYTLAGETFNINSPKQLQEILFNKLKLPILQKTPTGQASTADNVLQELAADFAIPRLIIECRSISKLISTYTNRLPQQINAVSKRVHTSYNQTGAATGRLSSSDPNLQNIPVRTNEGRRIRQAFVAKAGCKLISADYSQIELRLMAHISEEPNLLKAFAENLDIHIATAAEVRGISLEEVTQDMRREAKAVNFGLLYGMSAFGLAKQLGIDRKSAQEYIDRYFARYPNVKAYMENTRIQAKEKGYVETLWGRRLYLPDINSSQIPRQRASERAAINAPLQGSAADIIKMAMINIDRWLSEQNIPAKMIMQVHDELVFEVEEEYVTTAIKQIRQMMSEVVTIKVPLLVSIGSGDNWDAASAH